MIWIQLDRSQGSDTPGLLSILCYYLKYYFKTGGWMVTLTFWKPPPRAATYREDLSKSIGLMDSRISMLLKCYQTANWIKHGWFSSSSAYSWQWSRPSSAILDCCSATTWGWAGSINQDVESIKSERSSSAKRKQYSTLNKSRQEKEAPKQNQLRRKSFFMMNRQIDAVSAANCANTTRCPNLLATSMLLQCYLTTTWTYNALKFNICSVTVIWTQPQPYVVYCINTITAAILLWYYFSTTFIYHPSSSIFAPLGIELNVMHFCILFQC